MSLVKPEQPTGYVLQSPAPSLPPPSSTRGPVAWLRHNLFSSWLDTALTLGALYLLYLTIPPAVEFLITNAVFSGEDRQACLVTPERPDVGACWPYVMTRFEYFIYGQYTVAERWRVDLVFGLFALGLAWLLWPSLPRKDWGVLYFFCAFPLIAFFLLVGFPGALPSVPTNLWGGLLVTLILGAIGIVVSLPLGIVLALGRRSKLPIVKFASVVFIEFVRGVPLITVLFMANVMLPLFLPDGWRPDSLLRVIIGIAIFASAYMAEVVRGGLQAIPRGQFEGAMALGLSYSKMMTFIILPQALKLVIPGIVNTFIGLFKDTSLVAIVGIFDFMKTIEASRTDPNWASPTQAMTGYAFAAVVYFVFCFSMSRYSMWMERRLDTQHKR